MLAASAASGHTQATPFGNPWFRAKPIYLGTYDPFLPYEERIWNAFRGTFASSRSHLVAVQCPTCLDTNSKNAVLSCNLKRSRLVRIKIVNLIFDLPFAQFHHGSWNVARKPGHRSTQRLSGKTPQNCWCGTGSKANQTPLLSLSQLSDSKNYTNGFIWSTFGHQAAMELLHLRNRQLTRPLLQLPHMYQGRQLHPTKGPLVLPNGCRQNCHSCPPSCPHDGRLRKGRARLHSLWLRPRPHCLRMLVSLMSTILKIYSLNTHLLDCAIVLALPSNGALN